MKLNDFDVVSCFEHKFIEMVSFRIVRFSSQLLHCSLRITSQLLLYRWSQTKGCRSTLIGRCLFIFVLIKKFNDFQHRILYSQLLGMVYTPQMYRFHLIYCLSRCSIHYLISIATNVTKSYVEMFHGTPRNLQIHTIIQQCGVTVSTSGGDSIKNYVNSIIDIVAHWIASPNQLLGVVVRLPTQAI